MVLAWIDDELWRGQGQNGVNLTFQVKFDLEGQGQSPPKTIGTLTKLFCTFCPNLVVLAWMRGDLWPGQARGWRTHTQTDTHTDRQTQATTIPEGQNWPRVKRKKKRENENEKKKCSLFSFAFSAAWHRRKKKNRRNRQGFSDSMRWSCDHHNCRTRIINHLMMLLTLSDLGGWNSSS